MKLINSLKKRKRFLLDSKTLIYLGVSLVGIGIITIAYEVYRHNKKSNSKSQGNE